MLEIGTKVTWKSQAGGSWMVKSGEVVCKVPPNTLGWEVEGFDYSQYRKFGPDLAEGRDHDSYLVAVKVGKTDKAKKKLYWPRVSKLILVP